VFDVRALKYKLVRAGEIAGWTYNRHFEVTELVPEVFQGVCADEGGRKETDPFDTTDAANGPARHRKPEPPVKGERPDWDKYRDI
jgi:hypothetical protein